MNGNQLQYGKCKLIHAKIIAAFSVTVGLWLTAQIMNLLFVAGMFNISLVLYVTLMPIIAFIPFIFTHPYIPMSMIPFNDYYTGYVYGDI